MHRFATMTPCRHANMIPCPLSPHHHVIMPPPPMPPCTHPPHHYYTTMLSLLVCLFGCWLCADVCREITTNRVMTSSKNSQLEAILTATAVRVLKSNLKQKVFCYESEATIRMTRLPPHHNVLREQNLRPGVSISRYVWRVCCTLLLSLSLCWCCHFDMSHVLCVYVGQAVWRVVKGIQ